MTSQDVFDTVSKHLLTQNKQATEVIWGSTYCRYRTKEGLACAIGCLIPEDIYTPSMEHEAAVNIVNTWVPELRRHLGLLLCLRHIHDHVEPTHWSKELRKVALDHNLQYTL